VVCLPNGSGAITLRKIRQLRPCHCSYQYRLATPYPPLLCAAASPVEARNSPSMKEEQHNGVVMETVCRQTAIYNASLVPFLPSLLQATFQAFHSHIIFSCFASFKAPSLSCLLHHCIIHIVNNSRPQRFTVSTTRLSFQHAHSRLPLPILTYLYQNRPTSTDIDLPLSTSACLIGLLVSSSHPLSPTISMVHDSHSSRSPSTEPAHSCPP
jgi:hypothetical protein